MKTILVDMDGTIADWGAEWDRMLDSCLDLADGIRRHAQQTSFNLHEGCTPEQSELVNALMDAHGFYARLDPMPGAIDALHAMLDAGHDVRLVTSPWVTNPTCASDKIAWAMSHLGPDWGARTIITSDKTLVHGDVLIDDKPSVTGAHAPSWEHIRYTQPYNLNLPGRRLTDWADWKEAIA